MTNTTAALEKIDAALDDAIERLFTFLRIPSISADPGYAAQCETAAQWIADELSSIGCAAKVRPTTGRPMVVGHYAPPDATAKTQHVLFYGHYDVQPADPLDLWNTPPFEPRRAKNKKGVDQIIGRGAADDKGQLMTFVEAARAIMATDGKLPIRATFLIEGEEESGSPSLVPFLEANKKELSCDVAFVCDTNMWDAKTPAITTRLRGMAHDEVVVTGPAIDLHSGSYGGPATNPIKVLSALIASLHDKKGKVAIPGFYVGVNELPPATKKQWASLKFKEKAFLAGVGLKTAAGEKGRSVLEKLWSRPTAEVNGMWGGYTGVGGKTVIPAKAQAKFTFRLVGKQNPAKIIKAFRAHAKKQMVGDAKLSFVGRGHGAPASEINENNAFIRKSSAALKAEFGRDAVMMGAGGSIPIVRHFRDILGMDSVLVGFGLDDDAIHSPNEKYNVSSFHRGMRSWVRIIAELGK